MISRSNALKHGLAGKGTALPAAAQELIDERLASLTAEFPPTSQEERLLLRIVATDSVQLERCRVEEDAYLDDRAARAELFWDDDQRLDAERASKKLAKEPHVVARDLESTAQGCAMMVDLWESLRTRAVRNARPWDEACRSLALDLLGVRPLFRDGLTEIDPDPGQDLIAFQAGLAGREIARLKERREATLDDYDAMRRERAELSLNAPDKQLTLLRRYEGTTYRRWQSNMNRLKKRRATLSRLEADADPPPFDGLPLIQAAVAATNAAQQPPPPPDEEDEPPVAGEPGSFLAQLREMFAIDETEGPAPADEAPEPKVSRRARQERMAIDRKKARKRRRR